MLQPYTSQSSERAEKFCAYFCPNFACLLFKNNKSSPLILGLIVSSYYHHVFSESSQNISSAQYTRSMATKNKEGRVNKSQSTEFSQATNHSSYTISNWRKQQAKDRTKITESGSLNSMQEQSKEDYHITATRQRIHDWIHLHISLFITPAASGAKHFPIWRRGAAAGYFAALSLMNWKVYAVNLYSWQKVHTEVLHL